MAPVWARRQCIENPCVKNEQAELVNRASIAPSRMVSNATNALITNFADASREIRGKKVKLVFPAPEITRLYRH